MPAQQQQQQQAAVKALAALAKRQAKATAAATPTASSSASSTSSHAPKTKGGTTGVAAFAVAVGAAFFSLPFVAHWTKAENFTRKEDALNAAQIRRGAYLNSGSRDAGVDKDWDFYTNTWRGRRAGDPPRARSTPPPAAS
ncbi:hypothetical protein PybrP1_005569 [[Pythium] brassicae (nom. inval.)]|nr:hypothetical protein PybrP1_005569 [[Pythium] brassicae (nom. inval.)]